VSESERGRIGVNAERKGGAQTTNNGVLGERCEKEAPWIMEHTVARADEAKETLEGGAKALPAGLLGVLRVPLGGCAGSRKGAKAQGIGVDLGVQRPVLVVSAMGTVAGGR
jgi:hypothetical protein